MLYHHLQIPSSTWQIVENASKKTGVESDTLIEEAIRIYIGARLAGVPAEAVTPPIAVLSRDSSDTVRRRLAAPACPTPALRALMRESDD